MLFASKSINCQWIHENFLSYSSMQTYLQPIANVRICSPSKLTKLDYRPSSSPESKQVRSSSLRMITMPLRSSFRELCRKSNALRDFAKAILSCQTTSMSSLRFGTTSRKKITCNSTIAGVAGISSLKSNANVSIRTLNRKVICHKTTEKTEISTFFHLCWFFILTS